MTKFKLHEQRLFILFGDKLDVINRGGTYSLQSDYIDKRTGTKVEYVVGKDAKGNPKAKRFKFDESLRRFQTRDYDKDMNGLSQYEYLKNHPDCEGSPNGFYDKNGKQMGAVFREYDPQKDAETAFSADKLRVEAQATALNLDPQTLEEIANILGHYGEPDTAMRVRVIDFAGKRPSEFNDLLKAGDRSLRALVRKALQEGVFKMKGSLIMWEETLVGNSEDDAIAMLSRDQEMIDALKEKMSFKPDIKAAPNKGGRPKKVETL